MNLATRKTATWFKSDMRTGGGLDEISEATIEAVDYLKDLQCDLSGGGMPISNRLLLKKNPTGLDDFALDRLKRISYYAKLLENVSLFGLCCGVVIDCRASFLIF